MGKAVQCSFVEAFNGRFNLVMPSSEQRNAHAAVALEMNLV